MVSQDSFGLATVTEDAASALETLSLAGNAPSPISLYQLGLVLFELYETDSSTHASLHQTYQGLLEALPQSYTRNVLLHELTAALSTVVVQSGDRDEELAAATRSICGLYADSPLACRLGYSIELCSSLLSAYDVLKRPQQNQDRLTEALLRTLSSLLLDGLLTIHESEDDETLMQAIMEAVEALTSDPQNAFLGDMLEFQKGRHPSRTLPSMVQSRFPEPSPQREYLLLMLQSSRPKSTTKDAERVSDGTVRAKPNDTAGGGSSSNKRRHAPSAQQSEMQRRIRQVRELLPNLGEGYVEAALSCFQGDVERTVAALLEGESNPTALPVALQRMDTQLPARHKETTPDHYALNDDEAKRVTKERLAEMQRRQEAEAYALTVMNQRDEYDDDYDDQYDGMDGGDLGGGDGETYDVDLDTIRTYNRVARQAVQEEAFWEETRNVNRRRGGPQKPTSTGDDQEQKKYRGSDKGKGGRIIGPDGKYVPFQKGGKKGRQQRAKQQKADGGKESSKTDGENGELSKIQKRRKNDNKAKLANHHRKERAQKKTASGM